MANIDGESGMVKLSCTSKGTSARASSSWKHDTRKFGPQHALDGQTDSAWKSAPSEGNDPAFYEVHFHRPVLVKEMRVQFQGGFVGMDCIVHRRTSGDSAAGEQSNGESEWKEFDELYLDPVDSNKVQTFAVETESDGNETPQPCTALRIEFGRSTDFYGRIVIYSLEVWGEETTAL
ncbi:hypothetical protein ACHAXT_002365 [Thalassiosira profunda]